MLEIISPRPCCFFCVIGYTAAGHEIRFLVSRRSVALKLLRNFKSPSGLAPETTRQTLVLAR